LVRSSSLLEEIDANTPLAIKISTPITDLVFSSSVTHLRRLREPIGKSA
jgi:hypothetical protein